MGFFLTEVKTEGSKGQHEAVSSTAAGASADDPEGEEKEKGKDS